MRSSGENQGKIPNLLAVLVLLSLFGTPAYAGMSVWPATVNFGTHAVGSTSAPITVSVRNYEWRSVTISNASLSATQFSYSGPSLPVTLKPGQSLIGSVTFTPAAAQGYSATLEFTQLNGPTISIGLTGIGGQSSTVAPAITMQPSSATITAGQTATFSVAATGSTPMTYQWTGNGILIGGATSSSYTTPVVPTSANGAQLRVTVSNSAGSVTSNAANLTVNATAVPPAVAPAITTQPSSMTISSGQSATFSVATTGSTPMTYQWSMNGTQISGATFSSYTTPAETASANSSQFKVTVSNSAGSATSTTAILTVNAPAVPPAVAPAITTQPSSITITAGQTATFSVAVTGTSPMAYLWYKNGTAINGATSSTYATPAETTSDNNAQFDVVVSNTAGTATSNAATLTVNAAVTAPAITTQPSSQTVTAGQTATFTVGATGTSPMTYQWSKNGAAISGATSSTYTTPAETTGDNNAKFTAVVSNSAGSATSNAATLTVNAAVTAPAITTQPSSQTVTVGQTATFTVGATGTSPMTYQWSKNGAAISGATSSTYTTPAETTSDNNAQLDVVVSNSAGVATSNAATLTVNAAVTAPAITTQPSSQTVTAGQTATFTVGATGTSPMTYQWSKNGAPISGATSSTYTTPAETTSDNNAQFDVVVSNTAGSATSNAATLTVNAAVTAPAITTQPSSQTVTAGQTATFTVAATGTSPMTYQWSKNGAAISGATSSTYTTPAETTSDNSAKFTAVVTNSAGSATSNAATLTVNAAVTAPAITTQPSSQSVTAGQTATFTVGATGTSPMTYQWSKNGAAISGATSSTYTTPAETTGDNNAKFTAVVTNSAGSATSNVATLTVNAATLTLNASSSSLSFGSVTLSTTSSQNVTLTNAGNSTVTVSGVTISGAGFNASGVSSGLMLSPGQTATLVVTFDPSSAGSVTGSISVASNASNSPDAIALSGTGVAPVSHSATLSWTASTSSVMGYNSYFSSTSGGPYTKLNSSPDAVTSYTDSSVVAGQTYYFVVTAVDSSGDESAYSNEVSATIP